MQLENSRNQVEIMFEDAARSPLDGLARRGIESRFITNEQQSQRLQRVPSRRPTNRLVGEATFLTTKLSLSSARRGAVLRQARREDGPSMAIRNWAAGTNQSK